MSLNHFKYLRPKTIPQAVEYLAQYAGDETPQNEARIQIVAGGTDLVPSMKQRLFTPEAVLDIRGIDEMRGINVIPTIGVEIGALTPLSQIEDSEYIRSKYPVLRDAAMTVASPILRNMGTIGGNICLDTRCVWYNQSLQWRKSCGFCIKKDGDLCHVAPGGNKCWAVFSADTPPALLCLDAEIEIAGPSGVRRMPITEFYTNIGDRRSKLKRNELVTRVFLPKGMEGYRGSYQKLRLRGTIDYPLAGVAVALKLDRNGLIEHARMAITGVNPAPHLVPNVSRELIGAKPDEALAIKIGEMAAKVAKPLTTSLLTPEYRREMVRVFAKRAVLSAAAQV